MADIRLKTITVESTVSPLVIKGGDINITTTSVSSSLLTGSIITNGGISISASQDAVSATSGGCLTVGGGVGVIKSLYAGSDVIMDSSSGVFRVKGISENRLFLDTVANRMFYISLDGITKRLELLNTSLSVNITASSTSSTSGALQVSGGISIRATANSTSITTGGAITIGGGASINKRLYVGEGVISLASNTLGNLITTGGNVGIGTSEPNSLLTITPLNVGAKITLWDGGVSNKHFGFGVSGDHLNYHVSNTWNSHVFYASGKNGDGAELMRITGTGKVGIGRTDPSQALEVNGNILVEGSLNAMSLSNTIGSLFMTNGNVGIATTSPGAPLDIRVVGDAGKLIAQFGSNSGSNQPRIRFYDQKTEGPGPKIQFNSDTIGIIESSLGRLGLIGTHVGINTTNPNHTLEVDGDLYVSNYVTLIGPSHTIGSMVTTNGQLGIGTTSPSYKVDINGDLNFSGNLYKDGSIVNISTVTNAWVFLNNNAFFTSGNVSIGTTDTAYRLTVSNGDLYITSGSLRATGQTNSIGNIVINGDKMGVGVSNPVFNMDINGDARIRGTVASTNSTTGALIVTGGISIEATSDATSVTSGGALTVVGGCAIGGNVVVRGPVENLDSTASSITSAALLITGGITISTTENCTNVENGGGLTVLGGAAIASDVIVGGTIYSAICTTETVTVNGTASASNFTSGSFVTEGGVTIRCTSNAESVTNGGALLIAGGSAIEKDIHIGGNCYMYGSTEYRASEDLLNFYESNGTRMFSIDRSFFSKNFSISRYDETGVFIERGIELSYDDGWVKFNNTTSSISNSQASVIVAGGVSIASTVEATSLGNGGGLTVKGGVSVSKNVFIGGDVIMSSTTESNDMNSGAFLVSGGVGITGNLSVGGNTIINGNLLVNGETTSVQSNNMTVEDNVIVLNSGPSGSRDSGYVIQRFQSDNDTGSGDVVNDIDPATVVLPNQSGMTTLQVKLSNSASSSDEYYNGWWIKVGTGFSSNQVRKITNYVGSTRIATISSAWTSQNPSIGDTVFLYSKAYVGCIYNETDDLFEFGGTPQDPNAVNMSFTERLPIAISSILVASTESANSESAGSVKINGGIVISNTSESLSITSGGTFLTLGGASIGKTLRVGDALYVNGVDMTPNTYDTPSTRIFIGQNDVDTPSDFTGLEFDNSVWGFDAYVTLQVTANSNMYAHYHLRGVNKGTSWELVKTYVGDDTGVEFSITNNGQVQYTTPDYNGFVSAIFKWRTVVN